MLSPQFSNVSDQRIRITATGDRKTFDTTEYTDLLTQPDVALNDNRVIQRQVSIHLGQIVNLDIAMDEKAKFVAVAVLFRIPDRTRGTWKRVLSRDDLDPDEPQVVDVRDNTLILRSSK